MRSKEESHDYRYFPDPDLPSLVLDRVAVEAARAGLPELPAAKAARFREQYGLPAYDIEVLTASREVADYFEAVAREAGDAKAASNWVMTAVLAWMNEKQRPIRDLPVPPGHLAQLIGLTADGTLSVTIARRVFERMAETGQPPAEIVETEGLAQVRDVAQLRQWVAEVLAEHGAEVERYRAGEQKIFGFLMGQIMKKSRGKADPRQASALLREALEA